MGDTSKKMASYCPVCKMLGFSLWLWRNNIYVGKEGVYKYNWGRYFLRSISGGWDVR